MISDEPDEDADNLDDETAIEKIFESDSQPAAKIASPSVLAANWPTEQARRSVVKIDARIVGWFKMNHVDWIDTIEDILSGWIVMTDDQPPDSLSGA